MFAAINAKCIQLCELPIKATLFPKNRSGTSHIYIIAAQDTLTIAIKPQPLHDHNIGRQYNATKTPICITIVDLGFFIASMGLPLIHVSHMNLAYTHEPTHKNTYVGIVWFHVDAQKTYIINMDEVNVAVRSAFKKKPTILSSCKHVIVWYTKLKGTWIHVEM